MSSTVLCAVILLVCALTCSAAQGCKSRCGGEYYRGSMCQCDYNCLSYGECCKDFESQCTTKNSCKGRCGESFKRGRLCSCDSDCSKFKQCCSDHKLHCDAEEPTLNEATEPSLFSEGNDEDMNNQMFPNDEFTKYEVEDPEDSPIPESTSDYGWDTADPLDPIPTEPIPTEPIQDPDTLEFGTETFTVFPQTQTTISDNKPTQTDDNPSTRYPTIEEAPTESTIAIDPTSSSDPGTTLPQPTTAADHVSNQPTPTSVPQTEYSPTANTPELETAEEQLEDDILSVDPTAGPSAEPEVTTQSETASTGPTQASSTVPESSQVTTIPASTLDPTTIPEATTSNEPDVTTGPSSSPADLEDPPPSASPEGNGDLPELDALTTHIPSSTDAVQPDTTEEVTPGITTAHPLNVTPDPTKPAPSQVTSKPQDQPDPYKPSPTKPTLVKPSSKPETKPLDTAQTLNTGDPRDYQADDRNDTNLCSGRPVGAVTTLRNGTMVVFRGHYFWLLDKYMVPGPARGITQVWGVPSPIDTAFTRCNCQGKTYIFKGSQYWRFENDALDGNYPKAIEAGFDGLRGQITAALSVPQFQRRRESVYFFKRGGSVQKYSYQFGTSQTCGRKVQHAVYTVRNRMVRQAVSFLEPVVNIRTWRGFPSTITAAVSVPSIRTPERYKYYVFSRSTSYNVRMDSGHPIIPVPKANASPQSKDFLKCSERV
ncbi:proteoglycan 4b isoform X2 [Cyclopterus lumpus]|uniref:proteoglycan 4b isoform X2 n=1 Tax=Cyclopterus lumpus TaxID=8103 RepID=UPI0014872731|nr:proteoglycan 4b isoform X2 [Cyclopterus lumpus]